MVTAVNIPFDEHERLAWYVREIKNKRNEFVDSRAEVYPSPYGFDAFTVYHLQKKHGQPLRTKHPRLLKAIYDQEHALEEVIQGYAADLHRNMMSFSEFETMCRRMDYPMWLRNKVYENKREIWGI